jgi:hypothetical protein
MLLLLLHKFKYYVVWDSTAWAHLSIMYQRQRKQLEHIPKSLIYSFTADTDVKTISQGSLLLCAFIYMIYITSCYSPAH